MFVSFLSCSESFTHHAAHPGANDIDEHFRTAPFEQNIPVLLGLASVWNVSFLGYPARADPALLPGAVQAGTPHPAGPATSSFLPWAVAARSHVLAACAILPGPNRCLCTCSVSQSCSMDAPPMASSKSNRVAVAAYKAFSPIRLCEDHSAGRQAYHTTRIASLHGH